jgi:hypothetical protein
MEYRCEQWVQNGEAVLVVRCSGRGELRWPGEPTPASGSACGSGEQRARFCYYERMRKGDRGVRSGVPGCGWSALEGRAAGRSGHRPSLPLYGRRVAAGQAGKAGARVRVQASGRRRATWA